MIIFTICSNNYLGQAIVLGNSIKEHSPQHTFKIFLCDEKSKVIDYDQIQHEIIEIHTFEDEIYELAKKYNIIELNTAVKPTIFKYLFKKNIQKAIYLDPDICIFQSLKFLEEDLDEYSALLTPHILSPIPFDKKSPSENLFLNFGIYNLGFIGLKNDENINTLLEWWKNHTYTLGYIKPADGIFVDQLPINLAHIFFNNIKIYKHPGLNMAPWNLHERKLSVVHNRFKVNHTYDLVFYHFSSHKINKIELPLHYYNRYSLDERTDLLEIIQLYNNKLNNIGFLKYNHIKSTYSKIFDEEKNRVNQLKWEQMPLIKKIFINIKKVIPTSIKAKLQ